MAALNAKLHVHHDPSPPAMPFEDVALHALLLNSHSTGALQSTGDGAPGSAAAASASVSSAGAAASSPLIHKQRVAQLYAQSIAKRSEWASSLNVRSFSASSSRSHAGGSTSSARVSGPKAPRSWELPSSSSAALGAGRNGAGSSSRGAMLETIAAAAAEAELEAEAAAASSTSSSTPSRAAAFYDTQFLRPSPTSLSHADMRVGSAARLAAAAELQPEWRRLNSQQVPEGIALPLQGGHGSSTSVAGGKGKARKDDVGPCDADEGPRSGERALIQLLAVRFRRLACLGLLDVFQHGTQPDDRLFVEQELAIGLQARNIKAPKLSLVDMCLIRLVEAFEPVNSDSAKGKTPSRRRRRKAFHRQDDTADLGSESMDVLQAGQKMEHHEEGQQTEDFHFVQDSIQSLPAHLKARVTALIGRLACVHTTHAAEFLMALSYGSQALERSAYSKQVKEPAPDDWEAEEAVAELTLDARDEDLSRSHFPNERAGGLSELSQTSELDLSFVSTSIGVRDRLLGGYIISHGFGSNLRVLSLAGLNQPYLQVGEGGTSIDRPISPTDIINIVRLLPCLEILCLAGSCLSGSSEPRIRSGTGRRALAKTGSSCASCDQVFAAALGDMLYDVTLDHPHPLMSTWLVQLAKATPKLTVLDLSATCWVDDVVLELVPWISVLPDDAVSQSVDEEAAQSSSSASSRLRAGRAASDPDSAWTRAPSASPTLSHVRGALKSNSTPSSSGELVAESFRASAQARDKPIWPRLERLLLRGCPHLITAPPPGAILPEWPELDEMVYTKKRYLEQRKDIILTARKRKRAELARKIRGQINSKDPAVRWTEIIWDY
ncbi:hypothetical protein A4X13_0g2395 [Tilletia indica]|uniref:Uncharacterized protein n=1 Tax=Tilletia indica TaxID=43049 RepID=A0A177TQT4_9BASI|nr:hypothetical protein A4X13_0g2395 [Tilletia indica]